MRAAAFIAFLLAGAGAALLALRARGVADDSAALPSGDAGTVVETAAQPFFSAASIVDIVTAQVKKLFTLPGSAAPYADAIRAAEVKYSLAESLLGRLLYQESRYRPDIITGAQKSPAGALGIAQFMPATAAEFGINPLDPFASIDAAGKYLRRLFDRFGSWEQALAAYNWGQGNVARKGLTRAPQETRDYYAQILNDVEV